MIGFAAERLMKLEVGAKTSADYGQKSADWLANDGLPKSIRKRIVS
jgi:hypothetical protein